MVSVKIISPTPVIISGITRYTGHKHTISEAEFELTMLKYPNSLEIIPVRQAVSLREVVTNTVVPSENENVIQMTEEKPVRRPGRPPIKKVE